MKKPSTQISPFLQVPERTKNIILKKSFGEKIKAKFKSKMDKEDSWESSKYNQQILEFLTFIMFDWKQLDDKSLYDLAWRNEPRKSTREQIKP